MTKLYISPGACSFGAHVVVRELDLPVEIVKVKLRTPDSPILKVNPLGKVPTVETDEGHGISENTAILPYLADLKPGNALFAPAGSVERAQIQSWIGYLNSEVHAGTYRPANRPERYAESESGKAEVKAKGLAALKVAFAHVDRHLEGKDYLVGNRFTIADAYLGVFVRWLTKLDATEFGGFQNLNRFREAYLKRPAVIAVLAFEQNPA